MMMKDMADPKSIIASSVSELGYECVGIELPRGRGGGVLRIYIDKDGGIMSSDCETVSRSVSDLIDTTELSNDKHFTGRYYIEVSSPGIERPLFTEAHYAAAVGKLVKIQTNDKRRSVARIESAAEGRVSLKRADEGAEVVEIANIRRANLVYEDPITAHCKKNKKG